MAQQPTEPPATFQRSGTASGVAVITAALMVGLGTFATSEAAATAFAPARTGWEGIVRERVDIPMDGGWVAEGELSYPLGTEGELPTVVLLHGSGLNDMDQTLSGSASTFKPIAQAVNRQRFAVLRFNKRGVLGVGPVLSDDPAQLYPEKPYEQVLCDAAAAVRFARKHKRVDANRLFLLGHGEGTMVASNLAADPQRFGIVEPAGVVMLGVVGGGQRRFAPPAADLPLYCGPVLLLNGENDIRTRTSGAIAVDAALTRAGHEDHQLITYPGLGHLMNLTDKYSPGVGNPDEAVIKDVTAWLAKHR